MLQQSLECRPHRGFVRDAEPGELVERGVVSFDGFVGWFEGEGGHG